MSIESNAQCVVTNAVKSGRLVRPDSCSVCGITVNSDKIKNIIHPVDQYWPSAQTFWLQAHHDDYAKPKEVRWLCIYCHRQWHKEHGTYKNNGRIVMILHDNKKVNK
jgi:hypothetical protein